MDPSTVVVAVLRLLVRLGSGEPDDTLAVLTSAPDVLEPTETTMLTVAELPGSIVPSGQLTVLVPVQGPPWEAFAETSVAAEGSGSVTVTAVAAAGPK